MQHHSWHHISADPHTCSIKPDHDWTHITNTVFHNYCTVISKTFNVNTHYNRTDCNKHHQKKKGKTNTFHAVTVGRHVNVRTFSLGFKFLSQYEKQTRIIAIYNYVKQYHRRTQVMDRAHKINCSNNFVICFTNRKYKMVQYNNRIWYIGTYILTLWSHPLGTRQLSLSDFAF